MVKKYDGIREIVKVRYIYIYINEIYVWLTNSIKTIRVWKGECCYYNCKYCTYTRNTYIGYIMKNNNNTVKWKYNNLSLPSRFGC